MTKNWEAATFVSNSTSVSGGLSVNAMSLADGQFKIDWRTCTPCNRGFNTGHSHPDQELPGHNTTPSFGACCHCDETPENQCIFLRGWRIREMMRFSKTRLVVPISIDNVKNVEWRRAQLIKKGNDSLVKKVLKFERGSAAAEPEVSAPYHQLSC